MLFYEQYLTTTGPDSKLNSTAIDIFTLYALMNSSFWIETINWLLNRLLFQNKIVFLSLKIVFVRVLTNSKFGLFYSNFLILTPTFSKVPIEKYGKTPNFSGKQHFYSYFQNPSENSVLS